MPVFFCAKKAKTFGYHQIFPPPTMSSAISAYGRFKTIVLRWDATPLRQNMRSATEAVFRGETFAGETLLQFDKAGRAMAKRLMIEGRVQGVGYRASFANRALALGLSGWVRNRLDGSVEACVHGEVAAIEAIILWARRGPPAAQVRNVIIEDAAEAAPSDRTFKIC
jgi:acylphosphatase